MLLDICASLVLGLSGGSVFLFSGSCGLLVLRFFALVVCVLSCWAQGLFESFVSGVSSVCLPTLVFVSLAFGVGSPPLAVCVFLAFLVVLSGSPCVRFLGLLWVVGGRSWALRFLVTLVASVPQLL